MSGPKPSFSEVHVMRALFLIRKKGLIGRKEILKYLGIGEGSVRTLLNTLKEKELISSSRQGHSLTKKGTKRVNTHLKRFSEPIRITSVIVPGKKVAVLIRKKGKELKKGLKERDIALRAGADGALVFSYERERIKNPVPDFSFSDPDLLTQLKRVNPQESDAIVISFGKNHTLAENGAFAVALSLV